MLKLKELPISERPYEKLEIYGAEKLSNAELLGIIIKTGTKQENAVTIAQKILNLKTKNTSKIIGTNEIRLLQECTLEEFMEINGIGRVKAIQLKAVCELTKRMATPQNIQNIKIGNSKDVADLLMEEMRYEKREIVKLVILSSKNIILRILDVSYGGSNFAIIEPKEILLEAIKMQAPKIILVHNHPSGDPTPSKDDYKVTDRIYDCSELLGIELLDHIIIGDGIYRSVLSKNI